MQKFYPNLWFDTQAEEAANFYVSIFPGSKLLNTTHYPEVGQEVSGMAPGTVMTVEFELNGQKFTGLNGGPIFKFNEAVSFVVPCDSQEEIDEIWGKLSAVPESEQCGWLKDKYGVSWQIVPSNMDELLSGNDEAGNNRAMEAMLKMHKLDIAGLKAAASQA